LTAEGLRPTAASIVFDQAENRLHTQKALLEYLVCGRVSPDA
jgi:ornithine carbamoyltransferase